MPPTPLRLTFQCNSSHFTPQNFTTILQNPSSNTALMGQTSTSHTTFSTSTKFLSQRSICVFTSRDENCFRILKTFSKAPPSLEGLDVNGLGKWWVFGGGKSSQGKKMSQHTISWDRIVGGFAFHTPSPFVWWRKDAKSGHLEDFYPSSKSSLLKELLVGI